MLPQLLGTTDLNRGRPGGKEERREDESITTHPKMLHSKERCKLMHEKIAAVESVVWQTFHADPGDGVSL